MAIGLIGAFVAALAYGAATILQAIGVRRMAEATDATLVERARAGSMYAVGLGLDLVGFLASVAALRSLPLFLVESAVASSVGVTAVLAAMVLHVTLRRGEIVALCVVALGLVLLAISATEGPGRHVGHHGAVRLIWTVGLVAVIGLIGYFLRNRQASSVVLAATSGLGFGFVGIAARVMVVPPHWWQLLSSPVLWTMAAHGIISVVAFGFALERGRTTTVSAITFAVETIGPALIGLAFLGDHVRHRFGALAIAGFICTLGGCIALASRAEPEVPANT